MKPRIYVLFVFHLDGECKFVKTNIVVIKEIIMFLAATFCIQNLLFIQPRWQQNWPLWRPMSLHSAAHYIGSVIYYNFRMLRETCGREKFRNIQMDFYGQIAKSIAFWLEVSAPVYEHLTTYHKINLSLS